MTNIVQQNDGTHIHIYRNGEYFHYLVNGPFSVNNGTVVSYNGANVIRINPPQHNENNNNGNENNGGNDNENALAKYGWSNSWYKYDKSFLSDGGWI